MQNNSCLRAIQINLHKRQEANIDVVDWLRNNHNGIVLGQEPAQSKGKIMHISDLKNIDTFVGGLTKPRAFIALN